MTCCGGIEVVNGRCPVCGEDDWGDKEVASVKVTTVPGGHRGYIEADELAELQRCK